MPTDPTTKSQVQAYRFMLRRMESALVRKDSVMAHEPMRTHLTASVVGLILGVLGLAAFFVVGMFSPTSQVRPGDIVVSKATSAVYLVQDEPRRLIPVLNVASARLLIAAFTQDGAEPPETKFVEDSALAGFTRAPITGLQGAPPLPTPQDMVPGPWSVCDTMQDARQPSGVPTTTAAIGAGRPGRALGANQALLVQVPGDATTYLVHDGRRSAVDLGDGSAVRNTFHLEAVTPRPISFGVLNAIPEGRPLAPPRALGTDAVAPFAELNGARIGDVVRVELTENQYFLVLKQGKQRVSQAVADLIRYDRGRTEFATVAPEAIRRVPDVPTANRLDFGDFPADVPTVLSPDEGRNVCLTWTGPEQPAVITTSPDPQLPLGPGRSPVDVHGGGSGSGVVADRVFVEPNRAALVRSVLPGQQPGGGYLWLVTDLGTRYRVPTVAVAKSLGLGAAVTPAPESVLSLLPAGPELDPRRALELFDPALARRQHDGGG